MKKIRNGKKLNIAMLGHKIVPSGSGGIERVLTTMAPIMVSRGHNVTCYNRSGQEIENEFSDFVDKDVFNGVKLKKVPTINRRGLAAVSSSLFAAVKAAFGKYDIVHFHAEGPCAWLWIPKMFGKRCVATVHGLDWQREKWKGGFGSQYIRFGEKVMIKYADEVIVLSEGVRKYFKDTYGRDTVFIPNGVCRHEKRPPEEITNRFGLKGNDYFCSVSRLTSEKGIHYLIEAYKRLNTDKKLLIVGDSSDTDKYVSRIKEMAKNNPNIIFAGFASGNLLEEIFSNAYAYVIASDLEGMPLSLLEAMSYGNVVIGSDISEITEVVGNKGLIFKCGDVEDLAEKMQMVLNDREMFEKLKSSTADYVCNKYDWNRIVDETIQLYYGE